MKILFCKQLRNDTKERVSRFKFYVQEIVFKCRANDFDSFQKNLQEKVCFLPLIKLVFRLNKNVSWWTTSTPKKIKTKYKSINAIALKRLAKRRLTLSNKTRKLRSYSSNGLD